MEILEKIRNAIMPHLNGHKMGNVYLVGSIVYGNFDWHSDIDIVIISDKEVGRSLDSEIGNFGIKEGVTLGKLDIKIKKSYTYTTYKADLNQIKHPQTLHLSVINLETGRILYGSPEDEQFYINKKLKHNRIPNTRRKNTLSEIWGTNLINILTKEKI